MFNPAEIAAAKSQVIEELSESGQIGKIIETAEVFTFNGDTTGKQILEMHSNNALDGRYVQVSTTPRDIRTATQFTVLSEGGNETVPASMLHTEYNDYLGAEVSFALLPESVCLALCFHAPFTSGTEVYEGIYLAAPSEEFYVSSIEFAESVQTIPEKFLPGVCLPAVDIGEITLGTAAESVGEWVDLSNAESAAMENAYGNALPIVLRIVFGGEVMEALIAPYTVDGYKCVPSSVGAEMEINHYTTDKWGLRINAPTA